MEKTETVSGIFTKTTFVSVKTPKWLTPINNLARLFGLRVIPIGKPISLSEMTFIDPMKKKGE